MALNVDELKNDYIPTYSDTEKVEPKAGNDNEPTKANEKRKRKADKPKPKPKREFVFNRRYRYIFAFILAATAFFLLVASFSYFAQGASDQNFVMEHKILENAQNATIKNSCGPLGAAAADYFINRGFGLGFFFIIVLLFIYALRLINVTKISILNSTLTCLTATITTSSLLGFFAIGKGEFFAYGGHHGVYANQFLYNLSGFYGTLLVNLLLLIILTALCFNTLKKIFQAVSGFVVRQKEHQKASREAEEKEAAEKAKEQKKEAPAVIVPEEEPQKTPEIVVSFNEDNTHRYAAETKKDITPSIHFNESEMSDITVEKQETEKQSEPEHADSDNIEMTVTVNEIEKADEIEEEPFDPTAELSRYKFPPIELLREIKQNENNVDVEEQNENKERITKTLNDYGISIKSIGVTVGPTVTLYEIIPAEGVRIAKIKRLEDDIALNLAALGIRIIAPIPGRGTIGIEVPNKEPQTVSMHSVISSKKFQECKYELPIALGCTISKDIYIADLTKMPHILVAGATGQGKSVGLNAIITSLLYKKHPAELKFVMIDPKMVEFSLYSKLEYHYIAKLPNEEDSIITDMSKVVATLNSLVVEMENRYQLLRDAEVRNIKEYNTKFVAHRLNPEKGHRYLPYIVVVVDEFADLIMSAGKEVETPIARIAQKARGIGIHMILATQRPSTNVITGIIKANFPARIAFRVMQMVDSRTILDRPGANQLIGRGDMLISANNDLERVQCAFVDTPEVQDITNFIYNQIGFDEAYELPEYVPESAEGSNGGLGSISDRDPLFDEAASFIVSGGQTASTSSLQRRYSIGYNRAGKIMDQMEAAGIVGPSQGGKPRQVLIDSFQLSQILAK